MDTKREHRTHAEGSPRGNPYDLTYSPSGRLIGKYRENNSVTLSATVDMAYGYCDDYQPHAVKRMFDYKNGMLYDMRWDKAGNLGQVSIAKPGEMFEAGRFLFWTEDNRMHAAVDDRYYSYYAYDHSGERRLKLTGESNLMDVNADYMDVYTILDNPTLYPSAYMVLDNHGYTKHYYAGAERVAARIGSGNLDALCKTIDNNDDLLKNAEIAFEQSLEQTDGRFLPENDNACIMDNEYAQDEFDYWIDGIPSQIRTEIEISIEQFKLELFKWAGGCSQDESDVYFYHSDHLGSASWITDNHGDAVQHIQYLPYGESYINQRLSGYNERFTFTGKELDEETGYGYFGARYYDATLLTSWTAVDPMSDKYPNISPYAYCAWNPVKLVDPDGKEAMGNGDWYKDGESRIKWDPSITKETTLKDGEEYLGKTVLLTHSEGQTIYGDEQGKLHASVPLAEVTITADATTKETNANVAVPIGAVLWNQLSTTAGAVLEAAATIAWIIPACLLLSGDSGPNQDIRGGHENNVRKSTKGKHEGGDSRRLQDQQGSKGEKIMKGKRPQGYKGPWPPKKKNK